MTSVAAPPSTRHFVRGDGRRRSGARSPAVRRPIRPVVEIGLLSIGLLGLACVAVAFVPAFDRSQSATSDQAIWILSLGFGATLLTVFRIQFRANAILFSLSEIPLIFALVHLAPWTGLATRLVASTLVFGLIKRPPLHKHLFNLSMFAFETSVAYLIVRRLVPAGSADEVELVLSSTLAVTAASVLGSVAVALAVSRFVGDTLRHIVDELKAAWVLVVNAAMAGALLSLYLVSSSFAFLAVIPVIALWYMIRRHGILAQKLRDLDAVYGFAGKVGRSLELAEIGQSAVDEASHLLRAELTVLALVGAHQPVQVFATTPVAMSNDGWELDSWAPLMSGNRVQATTGRELSAAGFECFEQYGDTIVVPVDDEIGVIAVLVVARPRGTGNDFSTDDTNRATNLADQLASALRKGLLHRRLQYEAGHDTLTGLPNRAAIHRHLEQAALNTPTGRRAYVMMIDLDRFKEINDTLGHHAGDELLVEFTRRMSSELGPDDFLARLAGDEFVVVTAAIDDEPVLAVARRLIEVGSRPVTLNGLSMVVTSSVGIAHVRDGDDADVPLRQADIAMYDAKTRRVGAAFFRPEIDNRTTARLSMLGELRHAIEHGELGIEFQAQLDVATGSITGAEALSRWTHETHGVVSPTDFIRVAENTGLIRPLTDQVLARAIAELRSFHDRGHHISLSVNLSTHDLLDANLAAHVASYLSRHGVDATSLTLEITESSLLVDAPRTRATLHELDDLGVRMSIDDFGTGYSSLSHLRKLPVSELKVDQSFITTMLEDQQDEVIVRSTIELGHNLGLDVVAEGVATEQVLDRLREFGCDVAQGYAIARPLDSRRFIASLDRLTSQAGGPTHCPPVPGGTTRDLGSLSLTRISTD